MQGAGRWSGDQGCTRASFALRFGVSALQVGEEIGLGWRLKVGWIRIGRFIETSLPGLGS